MSASRGEPRREPGPPLTVWLGVSDAELLRYLRMVLAAAGPEFVREAAFDAEADVWVADASAPLPAPAARPVLYVGGRAMGAAAPRVAHLPSPFNAGALLDAIRKLAGPG